MLRRSHNGFNCPFYVTVVTKIHVKSFTRRPLFCSVCSVVFVSRLAFDYCCVLCDLFLFVFPVKPAVNSEAIVRVPTSKTR